MSFSYCSGLLKNSFIIVFYSDKSLFNELSRLFVGELGYYINSFIIHRSCFFT